MSDMAPDRAAEIVSEASGIWLPWERKNLTKMIFANSRSSRMSVEEYAHFMVQQWKDYKRDITKMSTTYPLAYAFFNSPIWHDPELWPYKSH